MLKLSVLHNTPLRPLTFSRSTILRITTNQDYPAALRAKHAFLQRGPTVVWPQGFSLNLLRSESDSAQLPPNNVLRIGPDLDYLSDGDVVRVGPDGRIRTVYRRAARSVSLLVTERCNSFCVMC